MGGFPICCGGGGRTPTLLPGTCAKTRYSTRLPALLLKVKVLRRGWYGHGRHCWPAPVAPPAVVLSPPHGTRSAGSARRLTARDRGATNLTSTSSCFHGSTRHSPPPAGCSWCANPPKLLPRCSRGRHRTSLGTLTMPLPPRRSGLTGRRDGLPSARPF